jgi:short-subunit dehydrogenase
LALVTGASSGIGADLARQLARKGHDLVLVARRQGALEELARELEQAGAVSTVIAMDLARPEAAARLVGEIEARGQTLDVLIDNAGFGDAADFAVAEPGRLMQMLQLNVVALTQLTRLVVPGMLARRRGRIMLVGSTAAFQPGPGMAVYFATKAFVLSLGEALAEELRGTGVTVTTLCPGATATGFAAAANARNRRLFKRRLAHVMSSAEVAEQGCRALLAGRPVVVTGALNKVMTATTHLVPRRLLLRVTRVVLASE